MSGSLQTADFKLGSALLQDNQRVTNNFEDNQSELLAVICSFYAQFQVLYYQDGIGINRPNTTDKMNNMGPSWDIDIDSYH